MTTDAKAAAVASPCIDVCKMDESSGWCGGCFRTIDEIAAWGALDDESRRAVLARLPARRIAFMRADDAER
jgi:predicted Fe-S protein YdhL (DUF1289 family)